MGDGRRLLRMAGLQLMVLLVLVGGAVAGVRGCGALRLARARAQLEREASLIPSRSARPDAAVLLLTDAEEEELWGIAAKPSSRWSPGEIARAQQMVTADSAFLSALEGGGLVAEEDDLDAAGRLLLVKGRLALLRTDVEAAVSLCGAMSRLAAEPGATIAAVRRRAILEAQQLALVQDLMAAKELSAAHLDRVRASILETDLRRAYARAIANEGIGVASVPAPESGSGMKSRIVSFLAKDSREAKVLEWRAGLAQKLELPWRDLRAEARGSDEKKAQEAALLAPIAGRIAATESIRNLARLAGEARHVAEEEGAYPASIDAIPGAERADPLTGETIQYRRGATGGATIMVRGGPQAWAEIAVTTFFETGPAIWLLPPEP